ncbi:hypothetical protein D030_5177A, partial [Vibrio parahaemolyticus AQ3810]
MGIFLTCQISLGSAVANNLFSPQVESRWSPLWAIRKEH